MDTESMPGRMGILEAREGNPSTQDGCRQEIREKRRENFRWSLEPGLSVTTRKQEPLWSEEEADRVAHGVTVSVA